MIVTAIANTLAVSDGGPARAALDLYVALGDAGSDVALVTMTGAFEGSLLAQDGGSPSGPGPVSLATGPGRAPRGVRQLVARIRASDIVIVHGFFLWWVPLAALVCAAAGTPFVLVPHGSLTLRQQGFSLGRKRAFELLPGRYVRSRMAAFIVGSELEAEELTATWPRSVVRVGGLGTRVPVPAPAATDWHHPVALVSLSRIAPKKRIDLMIRAVAVLREGGLDCALRIAGVGDPKLVARLHELRDELGLRQHVQFLGEVVGAAKDELFHGTDLFLLPSDDENFGIGLAEALAHGVPAVVSSNVAAAAAMRGRGGTVLEAPTPQSIADAVLRLRRAEDWRRIQADAHTVALEEFGWPRVADRWLRILSEFVRSAR